MSQSFVRSGSRIGSLAASALLAAAAFAAAGAVAVNAVTPKLSEERVARRYDASRSLFGGSLGGGRGGRRFRRGWSNRQVQRMAAKRRNQARARRAGRR